MISYLSQIEGEKYKVQNFKTLFVKQSFFSKSLSWLCTGLETFILSTPSHMCTDLDHEPNMKIFEITGIRLNKTRNLEQFGHSTFCSYTS